MTEEATKITLCARSDYPEKKAIFKIDPAVTFGEVKAQALKELKLDAKEGYTFIATRYGQDVIEFAHRPDDDKSTLRDKMTVFVLAPTHLKPERKIVTSKKEEEDKDKSEIGKFKGFTPQNALEKLQKATGAQRTTALQYIDIWATDVMKTKGFVKIPKDLLLELVKRDTINIDECDLFEAVVLWGKAKLAEEKLKDDATNLKATLKDIIPLIRFPLMTTEQLASKVTPAGLLSSQHVLDLFTYLAKKGKDDEKEAKLPESLPFSAKARSGRKLPLKELQNPTYVNWAQNGFQFDVKAKKNVVIAGLSVCTRNGGSHPISLWWKYGSGVGYSSTSTAWTAVSDMVVLFTEGIPSKLPCELKIKLKAGETCSFYLHTTDSNRGGIVSSGSHGSHDMNMDAFSDDFITVTNGPSHSTLWSGEASYACTLIGSVHYYG